MGALFEARIIDITWKSKTEVSRISVSKFPIDIEQLSNNKFELITTVYSKLDTGKAGLFAIKLNDSISDNPFFSINKTEKNELRPVKDPISGDVWWFAKDTWKGRYWVSDLFRTAGKVHLYVGSQQCTINIASNSFTVEELESYLSSFRNDFLELILDESSYVKGEVKAKGFNIDSESLTVFSKFIDHAEKVLHNPKVELKEVQNVLPRKKLRPVPRSFMEIASKGQATRLITSRDYQESLNIPENRYLLYTLERVLLITKSLTTVSESIQSKLEHTVSRYIKRLERFSNKISVDRELVLRDLEEKVENIHFLESELLSLNLYNTEGYIPAQDDWNLLFKITGDTNWEEGSAHFFVQVRKDNDKDKDWFKPNNGFCTLRVGDVDFVDKLKQFDEIEVTGSINKKSIVTSNGKNWHQYFLNSVSKVTFIKNDLTTTIERQNDHVNKLKGEITKLENTGWIRSLSRQEIDEQNKEKSSLEKLKTIASEHQKHLRMVSDVLKPKLPIIKSLIKQLMQHKVRPSSLFPNSMSFIQNAHYQGIHSQFKIIKNLTGLNDELFSAIEEVEEIGLINISELYERWCLLQVISVLMQRFGFLPEANWKKPFIKAVLVKNPKNIQIVFHSDTLKRRVRLTYECELENKDFTKKGNNTRPDIVLEFIARARKTKKFSSVKKLVLDAKFMDFFKTVEHSSRILKELYFDKDYREQGKNSVFILHPSRNSIKPRKNPLSWGCSSSLGEIKVFDWEETIAKLHDESSVNRKKHFHEFGTLYVSPTGDEDPLDNLQRLIGMFLQYSSEDNDLNGKLSEEVERREEILPEGTLFCIACGSHDIAHEWTTTSRGKPKLWTTCKSCNHFSVYNYCGKCKTRLIKNGSHWTYHATEPLEPLNVKCPKCAGIL